MAAPLYVETRIAASLDRLWAHTQDPVIHQRWDLRFTEIAPTGPGHFRYSTRVLPFLTVDGTGIHSGERHRPDGGRTSALRFASGHPLSLIAEGSGYWRYQPEPDGSVRFLTGYDYRVRWGRTGAILDRLAFRPLMGWATAWSFDRLRIWLEADVPPDRSRDSAIVELTVRLLLVLAALGAHPVLGAACGACAVLLPPRPATPAARRCRRRPVPARRPQEIR